MYKFSTILLLISLSVSAGLHAQDQKTGYIDSNQILERMPEYDGIEERMQLLSSEWNEELRELELEIERRKLEFEAREVLFTEEMRDARLAEIEELSRVYHEQLEQKFGPEGEYFIRQKELLEPVQRQLYEAVNRVADREGFDFIFDRAEDTRLLYAGSEWNMTREVISELGLTIESSQ